MRKMQRSVFFRDARRARSGESGSAVGRGAQHTARQRVSVRCKAIVIACGAIPVLRAAALRPAQQHIGHHLHLHPVSNVSGIFRKDSPWKATCRPFIPISFVSERELRREIRNHRATTAIQAAFCRGESPNIIACCSKASADRGIGTLLRDRRGLPVTVDLRAIRFRIIRSPHLIASTCGMAYRRGTHLEAAGAELIFRRTPSGVPTSRAPRLARKLMQAMDPPAGSGSLALFSVPHHGSARMGGHPRPSATNPRPNVGGPHLCHGWLRLPECFGVIHDSIEAIAHRNASILAARLRRS